ncbi:MAG: T9SS type A sorting domain-containing protein [Chitinispirillaceae bacterium]
MLTSEAKLERSELVLQVPHGEKLAVRVYDMKGVLVYHRVVERNNVLPVTTFVASGMYMIEVTEGRHTILNREMIIAR